MPYWWFIFMEVYANYLPTSAVGEKPNHEVFSQDFATVIVNLRQLINQQIAESGSDPNAIQHGFLSNTDSFQIPGQMVVTS